MLEVLDSQLSQLPITKSEIERIAQEIVESVGESGGALDVAVQIAALEELVKQIRASGDWIDCVLYEAPSETEHRGAIIKPAETGTRYKYEGCYSKWDELDKEIKKLTAEKRVCEERMKAVLKRGIVSFDEETGEQIQVPLKTSRSNYTITLKK